MPARVLMQDFTGVPAVVDLAAMRDAMKMLGGDPEKINPLQPAELVIDHSVQVDEYGTARSYDLNAMLEFQRNRERYAFLKWGQIGLPQLLGCASGHGHLPPGEPGISGARGVHDARRMAILQAYPDTLVGTDSHTTMINGLGVLGWGVGGIEAEAAMLGQPVSMLVPQVVGFKLTGRLNEGATATDLVLTVTRCCASWASSASSSSSTARASANLPLADRATISNMAPEYGATCGIFPVDAETLRYLRLTGRSRRADRAGRGVLQRAGTVPHRESPEAEYTTTIELDLSTVEPSVAGPKRPQDRVLLRDAAPSFEEALPKLLGPTATRTASGRWSAGRVKAVILAWRHGDCVRRSARAGTRHQYQGPLRHRIDKYMDTARS